MMRRRWITVLLVCALHGVVHGEQALEKFFAQHCVKCHGAEKQKSGFRIDVRELALVSYIHLRAYETYSERVIRFLLVKKFVSQF